MKKEIFLKETRRDFDASLQEKRGNYPLKRRGGGRPIAKKKGQFQKRGKRGGQHKTSRGENTAEGLDLSSTFQKSISKVYKGVLQKEQRGERGFMKGGGIFPAKRARTALEKGKKKGGKKKTATSGLKKRWKREGRKSDMQKRPNEGGWGVEELPRRQEG